MLGEEGGSAEEAKGEVEEETLTYRYLYGDGYRASLGPIRPWPFLEAGLIVCPPPKNQFMEAGTLR
jgi:hypothetical protein